MRVEFFGVRGSIAHAGPEVSRVGGNTACVMVEAGESRIILDAGTGLRALGERLVRESKARARPIQATLLFTHLHWDHIQGFPFFVPAYLPETELHLFGPLGEDGSRQLEDVLDQQMRPPTFPVRLSAMAATKHFSSLSGGETFDVGEARIRSTPLHHPQRCLGYRIEHAGRAVVFCTDTEPLPGGEIPERILDLAAGADLLIYDAQYTPEEYPAHRGWGHSTWRDAVAVARAAGVERLALFHHDPSHDDATVAAIERSAQALFPTAFAAREGCAVQL